MKKLILMFLAFCLLGLAAFSVIGQDIQTKGSIKGTVTDPGGAVVAGATVTITGAATDRTVTTNGDGTYEVTNLSPGVYKVHIEQKGFKAIESSPTVYVGKATVLDPKLEIGEASAVVEVTATNTIDQASTAVGSNLNDQLFTNVPVSRSVSGLFYLAPGTTDGLGGGKDNPSISGGSALDNLYVADGVNITNTAFGGIGTFSRSYGALGTGINTSFVKEVQVKTGGFEAQYGQSTGGIVNIITQSGGNAFHGAIYGYAKPDIFEGTYKQRDDTSSNKVGEMFAQELYDAGADFGGPVLKDKLFFFGSFNPSIRRDMVLGANGSGLRTILGEHVQRYRTYNYAGKVDWNIARDHQASFSIYGDPTETNTSSFSTLNIDNTTALSQLKFGSRNMALRYNGSLTSTWTLSASYGASWNRFDETGFGNFNGILDRTGIGVTPGASRGFFTSVGRGFVEPTNGATHTFAIDTAKIARFWGQHTFGFGAGYQKGYYSGVRDRSGPHYAIPAANATCVSPCPSALYSDPSVVGQTMNAAWSLRVQSPGDPSSCTLCPVFHVPGSTSDIGLGPGNRRVYLRLDRSEYGNPVFNTFSDYKYGYAQDTWRFNRFLTVNGGIRWEQERVTGSPGGSGDRSSYTFTGNWAPRVGVTVDPFGHGKMKAYYNFGRFYEYLPLDLAERSLSAEQDMGTLRFAPSFATCATPLQRADRCVVLNSFGTATPVVDSADLLTAATGGTGTKVGVSANDPGNPILRGTKLGYIDEHVIGFETQLPKDFVLSVRYIHRDLKRVVEDAAVEPVEDLLNGGLFGQAYALANVSSKLDMAINPIAHPFTPTFNAGGDVTNWPTACGPVSGGFPALGEIVPDPHDPTGTIILGAVCYDPNPNAGNFGSDGIPDGFADPVHKYRALEIEVNKRFSNSWQLLANWRYGSLEGNYEGHLRNDNGQTDPGISSLFDFTAGSFNLLGDQFAIGPLNTDRRHVINIFGSYAFTKDSFWSTVNGLNVGFNFHSESGLPINKFLADPAYGNAGEVPVGGRGSLGRTPWNNRIDAHVDYPWNFNERMRLKFVADFFNITNTRKVRLFNQNFEASLGVPNVDFLQPTSFYAPFNMRLGMRFEF